MQDATGNESLYESKQHEQWKDELPMAGGLGFAIALGRRVRLGDWKDQTLSTYSKIDEAVNDNRYRDASALADYFVDEAKVVYEIYAQWLSDLSQYLLRLGVSPSDVASASQQILANLGLPDGRPFISKRCWNEFLNQVREFHLLCGAGDREAALEMLARFKENWRRIHDRDVDHCYGLMNEIKERFGEPKIGEMFREVLVPLFNWRYKKFDVDRYPWDEALETLLYVACEAMRGHMCGPRRDGTFELWEEPERWAIRFDPCGSGGRSMRGDSIEGTPPRMEPPYNYGVTVKEYDWAWNKKGVCYYCVNCCMVMELMPIDAFGYPVRVVEPPTYPSSKDVKCTWYMYKDPTQVPEEYYTRLGRKKPSAFGSKAHRPQP